MTITNCLGVGEKGCQLEGHIGGLLGPGYVVFHDLDAHLHRCLLHNFPQNVHVLNTLLNVFYASK